MGKSKNNDNLVIIAPVGYKEMIILLSRCKLLITDSGGVSKEASFVGKKCFFTLRLDVWPELMEQGYINIVDIDDDNSVCRNIESIEEIIQSDKFLPQTDYFGMVMLLKL